MLSQLLAFRDAGASDFIVRVNAHVTAEQALTQIDILANTVLPGLARQLLPVAGFGEFVDQGGGGGVADAAPAGHLAVGVGTAGDCLSK